MLIYAVGSVIYGKLADICKLKNLMTFGLILFSFGSLFGLASEAYWMVLLSRILQAMGASVIPATSMIISIRYFPRAMRGRTIGSIAVGLALGFALGLVVAASLFSVADWKSLFLIPPLM